MSSSSSSSNAKIDDPIAKLMLDVHELREIVLNLQVQRGVCSVDRFVKIFVFFRCNLVSVNAVEFFIQTLVLNVRKPSLLNE